MNDIVHIITDQKFTMGYIKFMANEFREFNHTFLVPYMGDGWIKKENVPETELITFVRFRDLLVNKDINAKLNQANKIIISGMFDFNKVVFLWSKKLLDKTYIQLWGGDYFSIKSTWIDYITKQVCFRRCNALIYLLYGENEEFASATGYNKNKYFVAPMPEYPNYTLDFTNYRTKRNNGSKRILVGNSASKTNEHEEVFELLKKYRKEDIQVVVPLSYGDKSYGEKIIEMGRNIFGDKFMPILNYMDKTEYLDLLGSIDVAIFACWRQQALGNINLLHGLGKKIYVRKNTSVYKNYFVKGFKIFSYENIDEMNFAEFCEMSDEDYDNNCRLSDKWDKTQEAIEAWRNVLYDA